MKTYTGQNGVEYVELLPPSRIDIWPLDAPPSEMRSAATWEGANEIIRLFSRAAPKDGRHHVCVFLVVWPEDGTFRGEYQLAHGRTPDLASQCRQYLTFVAYNAAARAATATDDDIAMARAFLLKFDVCQAPIAANNVNG